jgi:battenin
MLVVALTATYVEGGTIAPKMAGVVLASLSSGGGEMSFLGLTHYYGPFSLAAWGSGTGGAGLVGAGAFAVATTSFGLSVRNTLLASSFLPAVMLVSFFLILPLGPLSRKVNAAEDRDNMYTPVEDHDVVHGFDEDALNEGLENESLLQQSSILSPSHKSRQAWRSHFLENLRRSGGLFFP